ncbi:MAG: DsbA family protein [Gammaproteobacteria bacterium]
MIRLIYLTLLALAAALVTTACTNDGEHDSGVLLTVQQGDAILEELKGIHQLLEDIKKQGGNTVPVKQKTPRTATLDISDDRPVLGSSDAPVTVVEYTDYQCPFCRRFAHSTFPLLKRDFIDTGKVRWQVRDLPLDFHNNARKAAQAALCASEQDKFWQLRDSLFRNSANLELEKIKVYANELKLNMQAFNTCFDSDKYLDEIDKDSAIAKQLRITGTPTFIIGRVVSNKLTGKLIVGAQSPAVFSAEINKQLDLKK